MCSVPASCYRTRKTLQVVSRSHPDLDYIFRRQMKHDSRGYEAHQPRSRATTMQSQDKNEASCQPGCSHPDTALQRLRCHHTTPPTSTKSPGSPRTVTAKIPYICCCVSTTLGSTSTGGFIVGARSSPMSQASVANTSSLLDI